MNQQYKKIIAKLNAEQKNKLRDAQRLWMKYRDSYFQAVTAWYSEDGGSMSRVNILAEALLVVKHQALTLKSLGSGNCNNIDGCGEN